MGMISRKTVSKRTAAHLRMMLLAFICLLVWVPFLLMAAACFMPEDELLWRYLSPLGIGKAPVRAALLPSYPTLEPFVELLLRSPFRHVLEFLHSGVSYACGAAFGGGSGSLGICPF